MNLIKQLNELIKKNEEVEEDYYNGYLSDKDVNPTLESINNRINSLAKILIKTINTLDNR